MPFPISSGEAQEIAELLHRRHEGLAWTEDALVAIVQAAERPMDVYWAVIGLRHCGTPRCVPALKALATHPKHDIKATSILTIAHVAGAAETPWFAQCLLDPAYRAKGFALWAIGEDGDARALDAVHAYATRRRKVLMDGGTDPREQMEIVAFFHRVLGCEATRALLADRYAWLRVALAAALARMHAVAVERFVARVPGLEGDLLAP